MTPKSRKTVVLRGAIGGVMGCLLKAGFMWIYYRFINPPTTWGYLGANPTLWFAMYGTPIAAGLGAIVAEMIGLINLKRRRDVSVIGRATIGSALIAVPGMILAVSEITPAMPNLFSWLIVATFYGDFGLGIGLVAGIAAGSRQRGRNGEREE